MPSFKVSAEVQSPVQKIWTALSDAPVIIPKIAPHAVASIDHVEGPKEGPGAVRVTKLVAPPGAFVKEKLIAIDQETLTYTTEEIEGGHLGQGFSKWVTNYKLTATSETSTLWEAVIDYEGENEAAIAISKEKLPKLLPALSEYVNSH